MIARPPRPARSCAAGLVAALALASCHPPAPRAAGTTPERPATDALLLADLTGTWEWRIETDEPGVHRIERERWHLDPVPGAPRATGAYDREVEIRASDGVPFACDQDVVYHQRVRYQVRAEIARGVVTLNEVGYEAEPSPCDHGFRRTGGYRATVGKDRLVLAWDAGSAAGAPTVPAGSQTLHRVAGGPLPARPPWPGLAPRWDGAWTWSGHTVDDDGNLRDEREDWQLAVGAGGLATATYVRTVTTTSIDGRPIACSGTRRWTYVDRYALDGHLDGALLTLTEVAVDAGPHPCLAPAPRRALDALTAQQDGEYLELEWRGKRRQVLHHPR
jgi:hypothetical protein